MTPYHSIYPYFTLIHPTLWRPKQCVEACLRWFHLARHPESIEYIFGVEPDDDETQMALEDLKTEHVVIGVLRNFLGQRIDRKRIDYKILPKNGIGWVGSCNEIATSSSGHVLLVVADDEQGCEGWDELLAAVTIDDVAAGRESVVLIREKFAKPDYQLGHFCLNRARYKKQGFVFYPGFHSMFADNDFVEQARRDGVLKKTDFAFEHHHPFFNKSIAWDKTYAVENAPEHYEAGEKLFWQRNPPPVDLNKCRLMIGTPCHQSQTPEYGHAMNVFAGEMAKVNGHVTVARQLQCSLVTKARNLIVDKFLASDCTHLLFCDADQDFEPQDPVRMMSYNLPVVGGIIPIKDLQWDRVLKFVRAKSFSELSDDEALHRLRTSGLRPAVEWMEDKAPDLNTADYVEVRRIGTGFMLIQRGVFEKIIETRQDLKIYTGDRSEPNPETHLYTFFNTSIEPETRKLLGEDWSFCDLVRSVGFKVYADTRARIGHIGSYRYAF